MGLFSGITKAISSVVKPVASLLSGGVGDVIQGGLSYLGQSSANDANLEIARQQMEFQADMSGTAYQRAVKDMQLAGLNPMLAYSQGGASTPSGASATMQDALSPAVNSARRGMEANAAVSKIKSEIGLQNTQKDVNLEQSRKLKSDTYLNGVLAQKARADERLSNANAYQATTNANRNKLETIKAMSQTGAIDTQNKLSKTYLPGRKTEAEIDSSAFGRLMRYLDRGSTSARGVRDAISGRGRPVHVKKEYMNVNYH